MPALPTDIEIRTAVCPVSDQALFLRNLRTLSADYNTHVICFNADKIAGRIHAVTAVTRAARAFDEGTAISNTIEMESLLYAAGSRQCDIAASFGIHEGENRLFVVCYPNHPGIWTALEPLMSFVHESWDRIDPAKKELLMETFSIRPEELLAAGGDCRITDLVLERVVMLQVTR